MKYHFGIRYELDIPTIHRRIEEQVNKNEPAYICAPDGNVISMVHNDSEYKEVVNGSMFSICDSGWAPIFIKWIYGTKYPQYCGSDIFMDTIKSRKYKMFFMGANRAVLDALKGNLAKRFTEVEKMTFYELPYCNVEDFDYKEIANAVNNDGADIIWVALGAPKQERFMHRLKPHLNKGVIIAVGAVFNFHCGLPDVPGRSPKWMHKYHVEFIHRIFKEPKKQIRRCWKIILSLPQIIIEEVKNKKQNQHL